jgi:hypothetical protein
MALVSDNVRVAVTGAVSVAPTTATAPVDADAALASPWADLGYVGEDGVTETRDRSTEKIKAWQNADVVRETVTEASVTYKWVMIETKQETVETYYGTTVDTSDGSIVVVPAQTGGRKSYVLDVVDDDDFIRTYVPSGEIMEVGDQVYANGEPIGYEVTVTAYPVAAISPATKALAKFTPAAVGGTDVWDYATNPQTFTINDGTGATSVTLTGDLVNVAGVVAAVDTALGAGYVVTAAGALVKIEAATAGAKTFTIAGTNAAAITGSAGYINTAGAAAKAGSSKKWYSSLVAA